MLKSGGTIYAIGVVGTPYVKIGKTTVPVEQRLQALQIGQPFPLEILATVQVEANLHRIEKQVHAFLEAERQRGEWFAFPMDLSTLETLIVRAAASIAAEEEQSSLSDRVAKEETGRRLLLARRKRDLTQQDLAKRCGSPYQIISRVERGEQDLYAQRLAVIAQQLGVSADYLLGLAEKEDGHA